MDVTYPSSRKVVAEILQTGIVPPRDGHDAGDHPPMYSFLLLPSPALLCFLFLMLSARLWKYRQDFTTRTNHDCTIT
jgi:hypothetical protein